jgi:hypothetical protein
LKVYKLGRSHKVSKIAQLGGKEWVSAVRETGEKYQRKNASPRRR